MRFIPAILAALALLAAPAAWGQSAQPVNVYPPFLAGQGTMTATGSSQPISSANVTLTTNSPAFPTGQSVNGYLRVKNAGTSAVYVCWLGGTCASSSGEPVAAGEAVTKGIRFLNFGTTPPSVIAGTGPQAIEVEW